MNLIDIFLFYIFINFVTAQNIPPPTNPNPPIPPTNPNPPPPTNPNPPVAPPTNPNPPIVPLPPPEPVPVPPPPEPVPVPPPLASVPQVPPPPPTQPRQQTPNVTTVSPPPPPTEPSSSEKSPEWLTGVIVMSIIVGISVVLYITIIAALRCKNKRRQRNNNIRIDDLFMANGVPGAHRMQNNNYRYNRYPQF